MAERWTKIRGSQIRADSIEPSDLKSTNSVADTLIPAYDLASTKFTWLERAKIDLSNLSSVAINTSLISDTDSTDDLGSTTKQWANLYIDRVICSTLTDLIIENDGQDKDIIFKINDGGVDTEVMRIDGDVGRVGIGTTSPADLLHVGTTGNNFIRITGTTRSYKIGLANGNDLSIVDASGGQNFMSMLAGASQISTQFETHIWTNKTDAGGGEYMRLTSLGLGIGTSTINAKLVVNGDIILPEGSGIYSDNGGTLYKSGRLLYREASTDIIHLGTPDYGNALYIDPYAGNADVIICPGTGRIGVGGVIAPTGAIHIRAGVASSNGAPLKFTSGTNLTTPEAGAVEWDGTNLFITQSSGPTRKTLAYTDTIPAGDIVQIVNTQTGAVATGTTTIPEDDSIPRITEGTQFMTLAITPANVNNMLLIEVVANGSFNGSSAVTCALFQDSTANALAATIKQHVGSGYYDTYTFKYYIAAGTISATTFRVRIGANAAGTFTFNGVNAGRLLGGVYLSSITITEIKV